MAKALRAVSRGFMSGTGASLLEASKKRALQAAGSPPQLLLVGLGNPGAEYEQTRHNAGKLLLQRLVGTQHFGEWCSSDGAEVAEGVLGGQNVLAVLPLTFMNLSGGPVAKLASRHNLQPEKCIIIHDDLDLAAGRVKIKAGGSSGGQRGVESCAASMGSADFWRLRIGIGRPVSKADVADYVLSPFTSREEETLSALFERLSSDELAHLLPDCTSADGRGRSALLNALARPATFSTGGRKRRACEPAVPCTGQRATHDVQHEARSNSGDCPQPAPAKRKQSRCTMATSLADARPADSHDGELSHVRLAPPVAAPMQCVAAAAVAAAAK